MSDARPAAPSLDRLLYLCRRSREKSTEPPSTSLPEKTLARPSTPLLPAEYKALARQGPPSPSTPGAQGAKPRNRRRLWLILGLLGALLLALCGGCGGVLYWAVASQLAPNQANEAVLLQDDLLNTTGAWPFQENHCGYVSSGYLVNGASCVANAGPFDDIDISVTVRQISGAVNGSYGVIFRQHDGQHDGQNAYIFDISTAGEWRFWKMTANSLFPDQPNLTFFVLRTPDQYIHSGGSANTLFVRAIGGHFTLYANNFKQGEVDDSGGYSSGGVGLVATDGARAAFTKLLVTRPTT